MEEATKKKSKISKGEITCIVLDSIVGLAGLVFIVLGFISAYLPKKSSENWTGEAAFADAMHMGYRVFGTILLIGAALLAVIFLNYFAKKSDVDNERAKRRAQRLKIIADSNEASAPKETNAVEATVTEAPTPSKSE